MSLSVHTRMHTHEHAHTNVTHTHARAQPHRGTGKSLTTRRRSRAISFHHNGVLIKPFRHSYLPWPTPRPQTARRDEDSAGSLRSTHPSFVKRRVLIAVLMGAGGLRRALGNRPSCSTLTFRRAKHTCKRFAS